ncbi:hypothetical protein [Hyalangium sp.]|uniref:hypothetical protein n=1 Tax=Hyalangium sp. TaxID=2028555 RepID=UPI002D4DADA7|nr:hypothetical protein [Hyalangium sp.]HYI00566.1 hypothetical protein [Hyalangium sp.]
MDTTTPPSDTTPGATPPTPSSEGEVARKARGKRERKPLTEEQRRKATARQAISRRLEALFSEGDPEAIERAAAALQGGTLTKEETPPAASTTPAPAAAAPGAPAPLPGWPTAEATARAMPLAMMAVQAMQLAAGLANVDLSKPRELVPGQKPVVFTDMLTEAAAPVVALYVPDFMNTPLGVLGCTLLTVASVCIAEAVMAKAAAEQAAHKVEGAGVAASGGASA